MSIFSTLFGPKTDYKELRKNGGVIVDVRTKGEYSGGHIKGSINIPLELFGSQMGRLKKNKPVLLCCASGIRSGSATRMLKSAGYAQAYNGGGWRRLESKLS